MTKTTKRITNTKNGLTEKQKEKRDARIVKLYNSGKYSFRSLSEKVGLSKSRCHEIVSQNY